jgi:hypothetical protein
MHAHGVMRHISSCQTNRSRRQLYETVLAVERAGGTVMERRLALVDLVLSPGAGLVICDNTTSKLVRRGIQSGAIKCRADAL